MSIVWIASLVQTFRPEAQKWNHEGSLEIRQRPNSPETILGKLWHKSTQGLIKTAPAGMGIPRSRRITNIDNTIPPPAESPASITVSGGCCDIK